MADNGEQLYRIQTSTKLVGILKGMKTTYHISSCIFNGFQFRETSSLALKINIISQYYSKCMLENDYSNILLLWQKNIIFTLNFLPKKNKKIIYIQNFVENCVPTIGYWMVKTYHKQAFQVYFSKKMLHSIEI